MFRFSLLVLFFACLCAANEEDPFAMFDYEDFEEVRPLLKSALETSSAGCELKLVQCRRSMKSLSAWRAVCMRRTRRGLASHSMKPAVVRDVSCSDGGASVESAFMRRHVRRTLAAIGLDSEDLDDDASLLAAREHFVLRLSFTDQQLASLRRFWQRGESLRLLEADQILAEALTAASVESVLVEGPPRWLRRLQFAATFEFWFALACAAPCLWLTTALMSHRSWGYLLVGSLFFSLGAGCLWNWQRLYREALMQRHLSALTAVPSACRPADDSWMDGLAYYFRSLVSFSSREDECRQYQRQLVVDPFWEVSPSLAVTETLTQFVLHPAERLGLAFGRFFAALNSVTPTVWFLPLVIISLSFLLVILALLLGYQIRLPLLLGSIGPSNAAPSIRPGIDGASEPHHVLIAGGSEDVHLLVSCSGVVRPLGAAAHSRVTVSVSSVPSDAIESGRSSVVVGALCAGSTSVYTVCSALYNVCSAGYGALVQTTLRRREKQLATIKDAEPGPIETPTAVNDVEPELVETLTAVNDIEPELVETLTASDDVIHSRQLIAAGLNTEKLPISTEPDVTSSQDHLQSAGNVPVTLETAISDGSSWQRGEESKVDEQHSSRGDDQIYRTGGGDEVDHEILLQPPSGRSGVEDLFPPPGSTVDKSGDLNGALCDNSPGKCDVSGACVTSPVNGRSSDVTPADPSSPFLTRVQEILHDAE